MWPTVRDELAALGCTGFVEHNRGDVMVVSFRRPDGLLCTRHTKRPISDLYADEVELLRWVLATTPPRPRGRAPA